jgi:oligopeptidase A
MIIAMSNPLLDTSSLPRFADISPADVVPAVSELIAAQRQKLDELLDTGASPEFDSIVATVELLGHDLSRAFSPVSHLNGVLGSRDWREAYNGALPLLTEFSTELSQDARLQRAYAAVLDKLPADAEPSRRSVVEHALRDFRLAGVDLPDADKARFKDIMRELAETQAAFEHNVQDAADAWNLPIADKAELAGLPEQAVVRAEAEARKRDRQGLLLTLDYPTYNDIMTYAHNRGLRETFYRAWATRASDQGTNPEWDNTGNIEKILALRHEAAQLVGFANYAEYSLATKMARTPKEVLDFLRELAVRSRKAGEAELAEITEFAKMALAPWDVAFWLEKLKQKKFSISNEELRQYFPARKAVNGLFEFAEQLYGITLAAKDGVATWHDDIVYYEVCDADGTPVGGFYTDLYARSGKRSGAWVDEYSSRMRLGGQSTLPVGYLVCNFPPPDANGQSLISHDNVVTLFHEFGHMLHHLLTRIDYPSIAGINGVPWDAVELPSQFMENFAWNFDVLQRCSAHTKTGEALPRKLFDRLEKTRHAGAALAMLRQLEFALFDFRLHVEYAPEKGARTLETLADTRREVALLQHPDYNRLPHAFAHIFGGGYAAGYYSYKWAEVLAADAYGAFEEAGVFDRDIARLFREEILEIGGSRDIMQAFIRFRGREPDVEALLRQSGIAAA